MRKGNLVTAAAFAALAIYVIWESQTFPASRRGVPGPAVYPRAIALIMLASAVSLLVSYFRMRPEEDRPIGLLSRDSVRVYACMAILVAYTVLLPVVGFVSLTTVMLSGLIAWFGRYKPYVSVAAAVGIVFIVYLVFSEILNVPLRFGWDHQYVGYFFNDIINLRSWF
ncbi:MAG: tripartite tricarboxylate transporter TctB family protein [Planctomycetes bacterium]|nr:tripartite tricarboxylate transporter TctB family protein [Planctomycetota bacterium]